MEKKRYKVKLNSVEKIEELLQETYDESCRLINQIQGEIDKLQSNVNLGVEGVSIDEKVKYAKAANDFMNAKKKAIDSKFEIAKFMGELAKHGGDLNGALNDANFAKNSKLDISMLKSIALTDGDGNDDFDSYNLKK